MSALKPAFEVDKEGLAKVLSRRGKEFVVLELLQNALDEDVTEVDIKFERLGSTQHWALTVVDDCPEGFKDLSHAYTLFAESGKKGNPEQRGRFNLGEKLVIALCRKASIKTVTGTVEFEGKYRTHSREKREVGSEFYGELKMSVEEAAKVKDALYTVIVPGGIAIKFNGEMLLRKELLNSTVKSLPTEIASEEGFLRRTRRNTKVETFKSDGESFLCELGIPVVATELPWHVNICQKVPLNTDRDNVTPAFMREVSALTLNLMHKDLTEEDAKSPWVDEALESGDLDDKAVSKVLDQRYGEKRVIADPSDPEGTKIAVTQGYTVIPAGSYSKEQWNTIRESNAVLPAGQVTPSPKSFSENGRPLKTTPREKWTPEMVWFEKYAKQVAYDLLGIVLTVTITHDGGFGFPACFGHKELTVSSFRNGKAWFSGKPTVEIDRLLIHEFAHHQVDDHLSSGFHEECCRLGALMVDRERNRA